MNTERQTLSKGAILTLANRSLVTIDDLSNGEMEALFSLADEMSDSMDEQLSLCHGKIMASLFFEPSSRHEEIKVYLVETDGTDEVAIVKSVGERQFIGKR